MRLAPALEQAAHDGLVEIGDWVVDAENADQLLERFTVKPATDQ